MESSENEARPAGKCASIIVGVIGTTLLLVERILCVGAQGPKQQKEPRYMYMYQVTCLASGGRLLYTPSIERVVD